MGKKWYYAVEGERQGPVTFDELRALALNGSLKAFDLVWQPEFGPEWRNAGQVRELFEPGPSDVPPVLEKEVWKTQPQLLGVTGMRPSPLLAVSQAFSRMVDLLFRPFDIARWFSTGFCAWLAYIGTQSSFNFQNTGEFSTGVMKKQADHILDKFVQIPAHPMELAVMTGAVLFALLFALWLCAVRSRGDFMFLHCWYRPATPIRQCWQASKAAGHELFVWRVYFFLIAFLLFVLNAAFAYGQVLKPYLAAGKVWDAVLTKPAVGCATAAVLLALAVQLVAHFAKAFVVPVMYWQGVTATRAWLVVFALVNQYPFAVMGYLACGMACGVVALFVIVAFGLMTCCIGFIPMVLPYLGAVTLLPFYFFFRGYPVCFLSQWRPELIPAAENRLG